LGTPAPGIVTWTGYIIPPAAPPQPITQLAPNIDEIQFDEGQLTVSIESTLAGNNVNEASYNASITPPSNQPSIVKLNECFVVYTEEGPVELMVDISADFKTIDPKYHEIFFNVISAKYLNKVSYGDNPFSECKPIENRKWYEFWKIKPLM
jgi:hypothetical protein